MWCDMLLFFQFMVKIGFVEQVVVLCLQVIEIVLYYWYIEVFWWCQIVVFNYIVQWQFIDVVVEQGFFIVVYYFMIMELIDLVFVKVEWCGCQVEQLDLWIDLLQVIDDLLILVVVIIVDVVVFIDDEQ